MVWELFKGALRTWRNKLTGRPHVRGNGLCGLIYSDGRRRIQVGVEYARGEYIIDPSTIISWEDKPEKVLAAAERIEIAHAVKAVLKSQWNAAAEIREYRSPVTF